MRKKILCIVFLAFSVCMFADEEQAIREKLAHYKQAMEKIQTSIAKRNQDIVNSGKLIVLLEKNAKDTAMLIAKGKQNIEESAKRKNLVYQAISKKTNTVYLISAGMKKEQELEKIILYNNALQKQTKELDSLIATHKNAVDDIKKNELSLQAQADQYQQKQKKLEITKQFLRRTVKEQAMLKKALAHVQEKVKTELEEYLATKKQEEKEEKKKRLLAFYWQNKNKNNSNSNNGNDNNSDNGNGNNNIDINNEIPDPDEEALTLLLFGAIPKGRWGGVADDDNENRRQNPKDGAWMRRINGVWVYEQPITNIQYWEKFRGMLYNDTSSQHLAATNINFKDAEEYAKWAGGSIPQYTQFEKLDQDMQSTIWEWTNSVHQKENAHIIKQVGQSPRLLIDNTENPEVGFRVILANE